VLSDIVRQSTVQADAVEDTPLQDRVSVSRSGLPINLVAGLLGMNVGGIPLSMSTVLQWSSARWA
jgi:hypothetical protein